MADAAILQPASAVRGRHFHFGAALVLLATVATGQPIATPATTPAEVLNEVVVSGSRLSDLKAAIVESEDRFYARYNELNKVDIFDIECTLDARTGTKMQRRVCLTKLQRDARRDEAREYLQSLQDTTKYVDLKYLAPGKPPDTDPVAIWNARYAEYRDNMLDLMKKNPDLRRLAGDGEAARKRFDAEYKRRLKGRLMVVE